ncbi:S8 family peptidase [Pectinatus cerevisiiphilus]|uniref:Subtilase family protein n=1 Tax=Pectinatus cerevisiiphilus TaxID=86956 RepID=A0A4R3K1W9_9FIRM|nr:S8 family peptidase [Pectinatus cerevisiiphilus]TCS75960.1 subtilase family protein [Pectinatus cerevisiiphilus]
MTDYKQLILSNGEYYVEPIRKKNSFPSKEQPHLYEESKTRLLKDLKKIQDTISENDKEIFVKDAKVICARLEPKFEAKSYQPNALLANTNIKLIGGRRYTIKDNKENIQQTKKEKAKLYFLKVTDDELSELEDNFATTHKDNNESWRKEICTIKSFDLLEPNEKVMGFSADWEQGPVEIIIHPLENSAEDALKGFFSITDIKKENVAVHTYDDGLTFICANLGKNTIDKLKTYNPLRSIKPIGKLRFDPLRSVTSVTDAPCLPDKIYKSQIKVGVFDGGIQNDITLLRNYVTPYDSVNTSADTGSLEHGISVCGAVLFGDLKKQLSKEKITNPTVSVESFRVFPAVKTGNTSDDLEMYTTIDIIESIVKEHKDIKIFNISFGPKGPIIDDDLNRFTYALDKLTYDVSSEDENPLFCVAAGNDGDVIFPGNRVQSPADMVNGLAIGAYTFVKNEKVRAKYSCVGPGREGAKIKPDVLEFGGSRDNPFICIASKNKIGISAGTSLASPVTAGKIGKLLAASKQIIPHLGRTLLIHCAESPKTTNINEVGFGYVPEDVTDILKCENNKVTTLYSGEFTASTSVKLPIFLPRINGMSGNVHIRWTISTVVNPNINDSDAYTNNCIEDTFYPHNMTFTFTKKGEKTVRLNLAAPHNAKTAATLLDNGYKCSDLPVSSSAKKYDSETNLRNNDFKWDTIIRKNKSMRLSSLLSPFLVLHAIGRNNFEHEKIRYYVAITVNVPKYNGSLYDATLQAYTNLVPITVRNVNKVMVAVHNKS